MNLTWLLCTLRESVGSIFLDYTSWLEDTLSSNSLMATYLWNKIQLFNTQFP